jgi:aspartyl-tRNA(Asn)/glutamyl-tRNA(Gln) amidotransferase subunit A
VYRDLGAEVRDAEWAGLKLSSAAACSVIRHDAEHLVQSVDVLVMPTSSAPAGTFADLNPLGQYETKPSYTRPFNLTGQPAMSIPCGFTDDGLRVGYAYEAARSWTSRAGRRPLIASER